MKRERNGERKERQKDRKDIFKCNNMTKKCAKCREGKREVRKRVSEIKKISLKLYNS
jgi:hypothetical protein